MRREEPRLERLSLPRMQTVLFTSKAVLRVNAVSQQSVPSLWGSGRRNTPPTYSPGSNRSSKSESADLKVRENSGLGVKPASSGVRTGSVRVTDASGMRRAAIVTKISVSCAGACVARGEVFSSATALPGNSALATSQSSAFFRHPGTPCAYSGLEISSASARPTS